MEKIPLIFSSNQQAADFLFQKFSPEMRLAAPLGLGKPNILINLLYEKFKKHSSRSLKIYTALSLTPPKFTDAWAKRLFDPIRDRIWGENYPELLYVQDSKSGNLPKNIQVSEFYFQAGSALGVESLQRSYQSVNYTHAAENILRVDAQLIVQLVAFKDTPNGRRYCLSSNPDMTLDVVDLFKKKGRKIFVVAILHTDLPFIGGDSEVPGDFFDSIVETTERPQRLFALPRMPISFEDHLIGYYCSTLVEDGGTLQIGIGSLSDAIVNALLMRQKKNADYLKLLLQLESKGSYSEVFVLGLYGLTEMLTDGFMHLRKAGILSREVRDENSGIKTYLHGSFYLGSSQLYMWLQGLSEREIKGLRMTRVSKVNDLYDPNEVLLRRQRVKARFFNTTMQVTLLGEAMSETLANGQVVSGVGGQYNFVAMSHELKESRSILMLRSTRIDSQGRKSSNIVWKAGHVTIPRHLRDVIVTEYGIADLRGKSDEECIQGLLNIADSEFQEKLLQEAQRSKKISYTYKIPERFKNNLKPALAARFSSEDVKTFFDPFALGSDFSKEENRLVLALQKLKEEKQQNSFNFYRRIFETPKDTQIFEPELRRMSLVNISSFKEKIFRRLLISYLKEL